MAVNDPLVPKARTPLSAEEAEWFASQIHPSWELLEPEALPADAKLADDGEQVASKPPIGGDTLIDPVPPLSLGPPSDGAADAVIKPMLIKSVEGSADPPADALPLPPARGKPLALAGGAAADKAAEVLRPSAPPVSQPRFGKTQVGIGSDEEPSSPSEVSAQAPADSSFNPTRTAILAPEAPIKSPASPLSAQAQLEPAEGSRPEVLAQALPQAPETAAPSGASPADPRAHGALKDRAAPASTEAEKPVKPARASSSRSHAESTAAPPVDGDTTDEKIEIPITSAPKGLLLKLGLAAAALVALVVGGKVVLSGSDRPSPAPTRNTAAVTAVAPTVVAPPPLPSDTGAPTAATTSTPDPALAASSLPTAVAAEPATATAAPPSATAAAAPPTAAPAAPPTAAPATPPAPPKPTAIAAAPPPPKPEPKSAPPKNPAPSPPAGGGPKKSGGGIIRETPF